MNKRDFNNWEKHWFYNNLFWHFILLQKLTGMSPEEGLKLKWKNVEIKDVGRISSSKRAEEYEQFLQEYKEEFGGDMDETIEGQETMASAAYRNKIIDPSAWAPDKGEMGREERLIAYIYTTRAKTGASREIPANAGVMLKRWMKFVKEHIKSVGIDMPITGETHVFASPYNEGFKPCHYIWAARNWREVRAAVQDKLKGHRFSNHPYTLYSLRSTFIEDHLIKGTDIFLLARIAGHDVKELQRSYERMDIRFRAKEITNIEYGKKKETPEDVNLLEMEFN
jgi:integrase